jgi:hypothetical protein
MPNGDLQINFHKAEVADTVNILRSHLIVREANPVILTRCVVCVPKYTLSVWAVCIFLGIPEIGHLRRFCHHSFLSVCKRSELTMFHPNQC